MKKTTEGLSQESFCLGWDSNPSPLEYMSESLRLAARTSQRHVIGWLMNMGLKGFGRKRFWSNLSCDCLRWWSKGVIIVGAKVVCSTLHTHAHTHARTHARTEAQMPDSTSEWVSSGRNLRRCNIEDTVLSKSAQATLPPDNEHSTNLRRW
jgi:hypothetical protein